VTAELDSLLAQGMHIVFIVDDNLIGNKKAKCAMHYHHHRMTTEMIDDPSLIASLSPTEVLLPCRNFILHRVEY
jgi:hypothetical protein